MQAQLFGQVKRVTAAPSIEDKDEQIHLVKEIFRHVAGDNDLLKQIKRKYKVKFLAMLTTEEAQDCLLYMNEYLGKDTK